MMHNATLLRIVRRVLPKDPGWLATWEEDHVFVTGPRDQGSPTFLFASEADLRVQYPALLNAVLAWERQQLPVTPALIRFVCNAEGRDADAAFPAPATIEAATSWYYYASHRPLRRGQDDMGQPALFVACPAEGKERLPLQKTTATYVVTQHYIDPQIVEGYTLTLIARPWTPDEEQQVRAHYALPDPITR